MPNLVAASADFDDLQRRRERVVRMCEAHLAALQQFHTGKHLQGLARSPVPVSAFELHPTESTDDDRLSITSAATCARSLLTSHDVGDNADFTPLLNGLADRYEQGDLTTRGLEHGNPYTLGQLLPTLRHMARDSETPAYVDWATARLTEELRGGGIAIENFPPHGYLTFWALTALEDWGALDLDAVQPALEWAREELYHHLALFASEDDDADVYQLGYSLLIQRRFNGSELKGSLLRAALREVFKAQLGSGLWEKKEPLFRYGDQGDAYPFTFELLTAMLRAFDGSDDYLEPHEDGLDRAVSWAERNGSGSPAVWRSGHLPSNSQPESWATAEVYRFLQLYRSYLSRRTLVVTQRGLLKIPSAPVRNPKVFSSLCQPSVTLNGGPSILIGDLLQERLLEPLKLSVTDDYSVARNPRRTDIPRSGIFFGPPGTGKTTYAKAIASYLGWPLLTINPADFAAEGLLLVPTVGARLFRHLAELEDTVIFFDEMEELMRKRDSEGGTFEQRFLTTSFLPHLQDLRDRATCIYLVATNNFNDLDDAARAPRRFDFQLQVRPPTFDEKMRRADDRHSKARVDAVRGELEHFKEKLEMATLRESDEIVARAVGDPGHAREVLEAFVPSLEAEWATIEQDSSDNAFVS
jgi:hypothetical protein